MTLGGENHRRVDGLSPPSVPSSRGAALLTPSVAGVALLGELGPPRPFPRSKPTTSGPLLALKRKYVSFISSITSLGSSANPATRPGDRKPLCQSCSLMMTHWVCFSFWEPVLE